MRLVIDVERDEEGHLAGWLMGTEGEERVSFVGTLELLSILTDRFAPRADTDAPREPQPEPDGRDGVPERRELHDGVRAHIGADPR